MTDGDDHAHVPVFDVLDAGYTIDVNGRRLPTVVIDAHDVPEIADLARVHATEGVGDIRTEAVRIDDTMVLGIRMTVPVRAVFAIVIDIGRHRELLDDVIEGGSLVVAHTDPHQAALDQTGLLAVDIDGAALAARLAS